MTITVYTTPYCPACRLTKRHLDQRGIPFTEMSLEDEGNRSAAIEMGCTTAPVVCASTPGGELTWDGYRPDRIDELARIGGMT